MAKKKIDQDNKEAMLEGEQLYVKSLQFENRYFPLSPQDRALDDSKHQCCILYKDDELKANCSCGATKKHNPEIADQSISCIHAELFKKEKKDKKRSK